MDVCSAAIACHQMPRKYLVDFMFHGLSSSSGPFVDSLLNDTKADLNKAKAIRK
jgi:hypothetical protein